jgi:hypothetical protein
VTETRKKRLEADHPDMLASMGNLTWTYRNQGRWSAAEELDTQVMETREKKPRADHPDILTSMNNLALKWKGQGRDKEAIRPMQECVSSRMRMLGALHHLKLSSAKALVGWKAENLEIDEGIIS